MSAALMVSFRKPVLPWADSPEDDKRFKRILRDVLIICVLLSLLVLFVPVRKPDPKTQELPPQLAKMMLENVQPPPPPKPVVETAQPDKADKPATEEQRKIEPNKEAKVPEARVPQPNKPPGEVAAARRKAAGVGLLAMSNDLAELRGAPMAVQLAPVKPGAGVGSGVGVGVGAGTDAGVPTRAMITSNATGGSGGINTGGYSSNTGGGGLAGRSTMMVEGAAGGGGGGGLGGGGARSRDGAGNNAGGSLQRSGSGKVSRSIEEIKLVFERNKGAIYSIYNRALREEPGLQGKVVVELTISPAGSVVKCTIVSSELKSPELEAKLKARISQFDFGAKSVEQMVVTWPLDFLPS